MAAEGLKHRATLIGLGAAMGLAVGGGVAMSGGDEYPNRLSDLVDKVAAGEAYTVGSFEKELDRVKMPATIGAGSAEFALNTMLRMAGEEVPVEDDTPGDRADKLKGIDPRTRAAGACTLALVNNLAMPQKAKESWNDARANEATDGDDAEKRAENFYRQAGDLCLTEVSSALEGDRPLSYIIIPVADS